MVHTENSVSLVCYDISSNKLRSKIDKCMKDFGTRLQFSVYMCRLDADGMTRCREKLAKVLKAYGDEKEPGDSLIIFERFNPSIASFLLGRRIECEEPMFGII